VNIPVHPAPIALRRPPGRTAGNRLPLSAVFLVLFVFNVPRFAQAQVQVEEAPERESRKVLTRVEPDYPTLLKAARIGGVVKLNAAVLPNGTVTKVTVLGGNPILADQARKAVMTWKFAPSPGPTNELLSFRFRP